MTTRKGKKKNLLYSKSKDISLGTLCQYYNIEVVVSQIESGRKFPTRLNETRTRVVRRPFRERVTRTLRGPTTCARSVGYQIESSCLSYFPREFSAQRPLAKSSEILEAELRSSSYLERKIRHGCSIKRVGRRRLGEAPRSEL